MRRADDVRQTEQRVRLRRLLREHVEGRARDMAGSDQLRQRRLVDKAAAGAVDDAHALLRLRDRLGREDVLRLLGQRRVQRDEIGALQKLVELDLLDAELDCALRREIRIIGDDAHPQADGALGDDGADIAAADDAEHLAGDLDAHEAVLLPFPAWVETSASGIWRASANIIAIACSAVVIELPKGVFITMTPVAVARRDLDIVDADAGAADHLEVLRLLPGAWP